MTTTWIQTASLLAFDLLEPKPELVRVGDIAHALARINRFSGHTHGEPYSVAHHSMLVADLLAAWGAPPAIVREGLLHDAGEAYYGDLTSPVKRAIRGFGEQMADPVAVLTERVDAVVRQTLGLPEHEHGLVKRADLVALAIERRDLFGGGLEAGDWAIPEYAPRTVPCGRVVGRFEKTAQPGPRLSLGGDDLCGWAVARDRFLELLAELDAEVGK